MAEHGVYTVERVRQHLAKVPDVLPWNLRKRLAAESAGMDVDLFEIIADDIKVNSPSIFNGIDCSSEEDLYVLSPPVGWCLTCTNRNREGYALQQHNKLVDIKYVTPMGGVKSKKKIELRCPKCRKNYTYDKFGDTDTGKRFYNQPRPSVMANDTNLVHRSVYQLQWSLA